MEAHLIQSLLQSTSILLQTQSRSLGFTFLGFNVAESSLERVDSLTHFLALSVQLLRFLLQLLFSLLVLDKHLQNTFICQSEVDSSYPYGVRLAHLSLELSTANLAV